MTTVRLALFFIIGKAPDKMFWSIAIVCYSQRKLSTSPVKHCTAQYWSERGDLFLEDHIGVAAFKLSVEQFKFEFIFT